jgi:hypothetical protein
VDGDDPHDPRDPQRPQPLEWDDAADATDDDGLGGLGRVEAIDGRRGGSMASEHVVAGQRGRSLPLVAGLVAALVAVGGLLASGGGGDDPASSGRDHGDGAPSSPEATGAELQVIKAGDVSTMYAQAAAGLGRAHTFAFSGTVRSVGPSILRPGRWVGEEVRVEGAVQLPLSITTEVAVAPDGTAAETVTSRSVAWTRWTAGVDDLAAAPWVVLRPPDLTMERARQGLGPPASRLGMAVVVDAIQSAADRRDAPPDESGRRVLRATVPEPRGTRTGTEHLADVFGGAELAITLDDGGEIARVEISAPPGRPVREITLEIERLGDSGVIDPAELAEPIAATLPPGALAEVGLGSVALPGLPETWALTDASVYRPDGSLGPVGPGCDGPVLYLDYDKLTGVLDGHLGLTIQRDTCDADGAPRTGTSVQPVELTAGRFTGSIDSSSIPDEVWGSVTDGTTAVSFTTDLPPPEAAAAIASLIPAGDTS